MAQERKFEINTPRGALFQTKTKHGKTIARLEWEKGFGPRSSQGFSKAQKFVDSECLRRCDPLTPRRTGYLIKSGQLGTVIGSGVLDDLAPYARRQYYNTSPTRSYDSRRGGMWFERMKTAHRTQILKLVNK